MSDSFPIEDIMFPEEFDQLLEGLQDDGEIILFATDQIDLDTEARMELNDLSSLPVTPLPRSDEDDGNGYNSIGNHQESSDSQESDSESIYTQISTKSSVQQRNQLPPTITARPKCNCEGCMLQDTCSTCSQCQIRGVCSCACCSYADLDEIQGALVELYKISVRHMPAFSIGDTVWCLKGVRCCAHTNPWRCSPLSNRKVGKKDVSTR